ncbi:unnamed protein product [Urochloa humidicola]
MSAAKTIPPDPRSAAAPAAAGGGAGETETPRERILRLPQDHIGSVEKRTRKAWVFEGRSLAHRAVTYVPGLHKIFDEVLLHAAGNKRRDATMDSLRVEVDAARCRVSFYYNGRGVPIELRGPEHGGVYAPEMIFGGGGNDGRGAEIAGVKLANVFSTEFAVEIVDSGVERKYRQIFSENMGKKTEPQVTVCLQGVNWTRITFKPDLAKFHMTHIDDDAIALMRKRVVDMVAFLGMTVQVVFNGQRIQRLESFSDYVFAYIKAALKEREEVPPRICNREKLVNDRWEVCATYSDGTFQQVSFVNRFATTQGGTHVDYVSDQIAARVAKICREKLGFKGEEREVKRHLWVFVNAFVENPAFDSPTRDALTTPPESFGSSCELSDQFISNVFQCIIDKLFPWNISYKDSKAQKRKR